MRKLILLFVLGCASGEKIYPAYECSCVDNQGTTAEAYFVGDFYAPGLEEHAVQYCYYYGPLGSIDNAVCECDRVGEGNELTERCGY